MTDLESDKGRPLTPEEIAKMRELLEKDARVTWFWGTLRVFAMWITTIVAAYYAMKTFLQDVVHGSLK